MLVAACCCREHKMWHIVTIENLLPSPKSPHVNMLIFIFVYLLYLLGQTCAVPHSHSNFILIVVKTLKITLYKLGHGSRQAHRRRCELTLSIGRFWFRPFTPQFRSGAKSCALLTSSGGLLLLPRSGEQWALCSIKVNIAEKEISQHIISVNKVEPRQSSRFQGRGITFTDTSVEGKEKEWHFHSVISILASKEKKEKVSLF